MAKPAPIRLAGTIAVTALCAALASKAAAQDGSVVLNEQIQLGEVLSGQTLNVVDARQQVTVNNAAIGNRIIGGTEGQDLAFRNRQTGFAAAVAQTRLNMAGQGNGRTTIVTQARVNDTSVAANNARLALDSEQAAYGAARAASALDNPDAHHLNGIAMTSAAYSNSLHAGGRNTVVTGTVRQLATQATVAETYAPARYVPGPSQFHAEATTNNVQIAGTGSSGQRIAVTQDNQAWTSASSVSSLANAHQAATTASAAGNRAALYNAGGSQVVGIEQTSHGQVTSRARTFAYDYGDLRALADGVGNEATIGNADIWVEVDNRQINTGGVQVEADLRGHNGYDAYIGANATGNSVTGYACSDCGGVVRATNSQINQGAVSATATSTLTGNSRALITGTTATGNAASFYVTRPQ